MVHIVADLEMNWLDFKYENERKISTNEMIEIGAVTMNEKFEEIGAFKMYVKPQFNDKVVKKVEKLTGITMDMLQDSPVFADAFDAFIKWCISFGEEVVMYAAIFNSYRDGTCCMWLQGVSSNESKYSGNELWICVGTIYKIFIFYGLKV